MMAPGLIKFIAVALSITSNLNVAPAELGNPIIEIPKISLKQEFYPNDLEKNNVDQNIEVIETSEMPDKKQGNLILAAHSGSSSVGYFKHLDQLTLNDVVYIYYKNNKYKYVISDIYDVEKTGYVAIKRDQTKQTLTLITCKKNTNQQTVYIGYQTPK